MAATSTDAQDDTSQARGLNVSDAAFDRFREQTSNPGSGNSMGLIAAAGFLAAVVLLLVALEAGANLQQLLIGAIALAIGNVIASLLWSARNNRNS